MIAWKTFNIYSSFEKKREIRKKKRFNYFKSKIFMQMLIWIR